MLRSVWFSNLDLMVGNIQFLQDDDYEYQQPSEPYFTHQSNQSEQCYLTTNKYYDDAGYRVSTRHNCNCTGDCDNYDRHVTKLEHDLINIKLNDSINEYAELYSELSK